MIISHFLLNLRQLGHHSYDDGTLGRPSFVLSQYGDPTGSHTPSLRFATIVDNMGANLDYGFGPTFDAVDWNTTDDEANASRVNRKCDVENSVDGVHASDRSNTDAWLGGAALAGIQSQLSNFGQPHSMQSGVSATLASKNGTA
ncbi:hypothetical protein OBBRIDRAFT_300265 [Obba rivulosa]|uniref:Uncharacterized protein n=1 Tax=Obba rivulosa TaxID=1052685 RepID=A0A8E2ANN3_9APHY|nr:hypothetical protein OBBRIDRAFT_300265 [Obba rivulosa]